MRRSGAVKFPNSVQLFKFCQKVLVTQRGGKVHDQEVGAILGFNPSDCSHWKRGEKNVRSVFALAKLAEALNVEPTLIHDVSVWKQNSVYWFPLSRFWGFSCKKNARQRLTFRKRCRCCSTKEIRLELIKTGAKQIACVTRFSPMDLKS